MARAQKVYDGNNNPNDGCHNCMVVPIPTHTCFNPQAQVLAQGEVFEFVPDAEGTWEYQDLVTGMTARFTASETTVPPGAQCIW